MWSVFFVLSHRCTDLRGDRPAAPHQQKSVGQSKIPPPLSLSVSHSFVRSHARALVHGHSHTLSSMSAARQQQVSEDRGHLCSGPPSPLLRLWSPLLGEDWPWRASRQPCLSALTSTPPRHKIPLMGTHLLWHRDLSLYIYRPPPLFSLNVDPNTFGEAFSSHHSINWKASLGFHCIYIPPWK